RRGGGPWPGGRSSEALSFRQGAKRVTVLRHELPAQLELLLNFGVVRRQQVSTRRLDGEKRVVFFDSEANEHFFGNDHPRGCPHGPQLQFHGPTSILIDIIIRRGSAYHKGEDRGAGGTGHGAGAI